MIETETYRAEDKSFLEFRHKVRVSEILSSSTVQLLRDLRFNGRLSVVIQNGQVLKSGYEEGYFRKMESGVSAHL